MIKHSFNSTCGKAFVLSLLVVLFLARSLWAEDAALVHWNALAPSTEPYDDPFIDMPYKHKEDLRAVLQASAADDDPALKITAQAARERLWLAGYDANYLLAQRLIVMEKRREEATGVSQRFLGQELILDGYVLPLEWQDDRVHAFLLVPWVGACIHTPPPPPNQIVRVDVPEGIEVGQTFEPIRLRGTLEHKPSRNNLYLVDGQSVVDASYALTGAAIWGTPGEIVASADTGQQGSLVNRAQAWISNLFTSAMTSIDQGRSFATIAFALGVAFLYGVLHTLGPGHGKAVVISYFAGEGGNMRRGLLMGCKIAVVHVFSAVVTVFLLDFAIRQTTGGPASDYRLIKLSSYALIVTIGLWMLWNSVAFLRGAQGATPAHAGAHHHHHHDHHHAAGSHAGCGACAAAERLSSRSDGWLAMAVGVVPCTGALIVMLFGLANDLVMPAVAMVAAISLGMALAMSAIGAAAIWSRALVASRVGESAKANNRFEASARLGGALCVLTVGVVLFVATMNASAVAPTAKTDELSQLHKTNAKTKNE